jgi:ABC-type antimicrobial peptide transport system permease subunit
MVITGILSRPSGGRGEDDLWLGFASYEYLSSHGLYASYPVNLLVVPIEGRKAEMDAWLRDEVHSDLAEVLTYKWMQNNYRVLMLIPLAVFGIVEFIIAVVAAIALAVLSYTFFAQRQEEFGTLHALGHSRSWLVLRTVRETASIVAIAWLISALLCGIFLAFVQISLYTPNGLSLNFFSPVPWLFTLPLPLSVVIVSAGLVAWTLRRLDAVAIIERR